MDRRVFKRIPFAIEIDPPESGPNWEPQIKKCAHFSSMDIVGDEFLGEGSQGRVVKAQVPFFGICAVKYLDYYRTRRFHREMLASQMLAYHPNILNFYGTVQNEDNIDIGFVSEFMEGGNLQEVIYKTRETEEVAWMKYAVFWAIQIARALAYCHSKNVVHGDVKPESTLLSRDLRTIKLCDFGVSLATESILTSLCRGTPLYMAPEVFLGMRSVADLSTSADVYSYGMFLYTLFTRKRLNEPAGIFEHYWRLYKGSRPPISDTIPEEIRNIIKDCWPYNPTERANMKEVTERLENYWDRNYPDEEPF